MLTQYTYVREGITLTYLSTLVPGGGGSVDSQRPWAYQSVTWDDAFKDDLDEAMATRGWSFGWAGAAPPAKTIAEVVASFLAADAPDINTADGWTDVATASVSTFGGSSLGVQVTAICTGSVGVPQARLIIDGGAYTNQQIGADQYDFAGGSSRQPTAFHVPTALADTSPTLTTYTVKLQIQSQGVSGTATPRKGTGITLIEHR